VTSFRTSKFFSSGGTAPTLAIRGLLSLSKIRDYFKRIGNFYSKDSITEGK